MPQILSPFVSLVAVPGWIHNGALGIGNLARVGYKDGVGEIAQAGHGSQFLLLGSGPQMRGDASWSTTISDLKPGVTYTLGFLMGSQLPQVASTVKVSFFTGSSTPAQTFMMSPMALPYWGTWEPKQMTFFATGTTAELVFSIFEQGSELGLDFVTVTVPPPPVLPPTITSASLPINQLQVFAPGDPMIVTGTNLGTGPSDAAAIIVGGLPAPLVNFVSSESLLVQVPVDSRLGARDLTATRAGVTTDAIKVTVAAFTPAIYYQGASAFTDSAGNPITLSHKAVPGSSVTCVAIGLGPTNPPMVAGAKALTASPVVTPVTVMVGNTMVVPDVAGLLVGSVTDYQVTFKVPTATPSAAQPVTISVGGATSNVVTLLVGAPAPHIDAVVNGATFKSGTAAPNSFVSIFGSSFGSEDTPSNIFPATSFDQVSVSVNGRLVPLYIVAGTKGQINLVLPSELPESGTAFVQVTNSQGTSATFLLPLAAYSVGMFRIADPSNPNRKNGAVLFSNSAWKVMPLSMAAALGLPSCASITKASVCGQPAKARDEVQIYLTGLGKATANGVGSGSVLPTGSLAPADGSVLYRTVATPVVKVGGIQAEVSFSGIAPGNAGQYQINIAIPDGVEAGDDVPVTVTMPDGSTDTVTIAVVGG